MRVTKLAITGMLAACVVFPAAAAKKQTNSQAAASKTWEQCNAEALKFGLIPSRKGNAEFMKECVAGNTRQSAAAPKKVAVSKTWEQCHAEALRYGLHPSHQGNNEFMKECVAGNTPQ